MNRASSYELATDRLTYRNSLHNGVTTGSTGLWSTTSDLEKWLLHLVQLRHTRPQLLNRIMKTTTLENGVAVNYGYGWEIDELFEKKLLFHNGVDAGYNSQIYFFPEDDIAIAVVSNNGNYSFNLANQIVEIIFDVKPSVPVVLKEQSEATTEKLSIELKEVDVQRILGDYELGDGNILTIKKVGDYLFRTIAGRADEALTATSLSTVFYDSRPEVELRFENISEDGNFEGFYLVVDGNEIEFCRRIVKPNEDLLKSLVGDFVHSELNIRMKVEYEASKLYLSHYKHGKMLLNASSKPLEFLGTDWWINRVFFRKNKNGNISLHLINPPAGERFEGVRLEMAK